MVGLENLPLCIVIFLPYAYRDESGRGAPKFRILSFAEKPFLRRISEKSGGRQFLKIFWDFASFDKKRRKGHAILSPTRQETRPEGLGRLLCGDGGQAFGTCAFRAVFSDFEFHFAEKDGMWENGCQRI